MVCSMKKEGAFASSTSRIAVRKDDRLGVDFPIVCWHCDPCVAIQNCDEKALQRNNEGLVFLEEEKCIGCGKCVETCVLGAIRLHPVGGTPLVCDQCGGTPMCVQKCPTKALMYRETAEKRPRSPDHVIKDSLRRWGIVA